MSLYCVFILSFPATDWFPGWSQLNSSSRQPSDDGFSNEDCVEMRRQFSYSDKRSGLTDSYYWNDRNCNIQNPFICQYSKNPGKYHNTRRASCIFVRYISELFILKGLKGS